MRLRELLDADGLGLVLLVGPDGADGVLDRPVRAVPTLDLADPGRFLRGGELVLTELAWWHEDGDAEPFVGALARAGVTALAAGQAAHGCVPDDLVRACRRHGLPLIAVRPETPFTAVTEHVLRRLPGRHVADLAALVERHRQLLTGRTSAPDAVLELVRQSLGIELRVLSVTGRQVAGSRPGPHAKTAAALAARYLAARRSGRAAPHRVTFGNRIHTLMPVPEPGGPSAPDCAAEWGDWLLVVEADTSGWPAPESELLGRITELIADARSAHERGKAALHDLARRLLDLLYGRVPPEEIPVRLSATAQALVSQVSHWPPCQFVVAEGRWHGSRPIPAAALRVLLEEALLRPDGPMPVSPQDIAATVDGDQAVLLVLVPGRTPGTSPGPTLDHAALQRTLTAALARWLGPADRIRVGVSSPAETPGSARRALDEARTALRAAHDSAQRVAVRGSDELTSHVLSLLPLIPAETLQAFATRLLGPLRNHDSRHRTELLPTLRTFLDCDASWTKCAAELHLHVNSLRQRMSRIEQLTGRDLTTLETRLDFLAALSTVATTDT
ncbi:PucR family transcriptional regulator ligand-binding domain-containing protein [Streptomyces sp. NPDC029216]|uniref:PucR family transcriptional regulator ligand-binding domain-containing protein n=1 Tax=Streptomyces sp. NPDC029216 TaxID=3154701 RepID=UPI0033CB18D8